MLKLQDNCRICGKDLYEYFNLRSCDNDYLEKDHYYSTYIIFENDPKEDCVEEFKIDNILIRYYSKSGKASVYNDNELKKMKFKSIEDLLEYINVLRAFK